MKKISTHFADYLKGNYEPFCSYWSTPSLAGRKGVSSKIQTAMPVNRWESRPYLCESLARLCEENLGGTVSRISFPGGDSRGACRIYWDDGRTAIASYRTEPGRARLEERVLFHLGRQRAPAPELLYFNGIVLIQEDLAGQRLSALLATADRDTGGKLLSSGLESLNSIHLAAEREGLDRSVPLLGCEDNWISRHIRQLDKIAGFFELPVPEGLPRQHLHDILLPLNPRFIKWDARPGNAMVDSDGKIAWFDWEHCGARNRLDDLVWFLCDESVPVDPATEQALLEKYLPLFADGMPLESAYRYTYVAGMLHCTARLGLILYKKFDDDWWDIQEILDYDYIGVSLPLAQRLCLRAADWARREPLISSLSDWFMELAERMQDV